MKMRKLIAKILIIAVISTMLIGCGKKAENIPENPTQSTEGEQQEETVTEVDTAVVEVEDGADVTETEAEVEETALEKVFPGEVTLTDEVYEYYCKEDWQKVYKDIVAGASNPEDEFDYNMFNLAVYGLYDIDKDNVPELLVTTGTCEADYQTDIYKYENGSAKHAGIIYSGHTQFYTYPDGNGIIQHYAHMGYASALLFKLEGGEIKEEEKSLFDDNLNERAEIDIDAEYIPVSSVVPDTEPIMFYSCKYVYGILSFGEKIVSDSAISHDEFEEKIQNIFEQKDKFYAVKSVSYWESAANGFAGETSLMDIMEDPDALGSTPGERVVKDHFFGDFDDDGYEECLAVLEESEYKNKQLILFTYQNGYIYGYVGTLLYDAEVEVVDDKIYMSQYYGCYRLGYDYCLDQCTYETYIVDHMPMSQEAQNSVTLFRQDLKGDNGELGVCLLGYSGNYSGVFMSEVLKNIREQYQDEAFMRELTRCKVVAQPGEEVYLLVPASNNFTISVYEVIWGSDTADGMPQRGELLYKGEPGEMVIVRGNESDIVSNLEISVRANGRDLVYSPSLSLENGKVQTQNKVVDFTRYN